MSPLCLIVYASYHSNRRKCDFVHGIIHGCHRRSGRFFCGDKKWACDHRAWQALWKYVRCDCDRDDYSDYNCCSDDYDHVCDHRDKHNDDSNETNHMKSLAQDFVNHYDDVIMSAIASQITSLTVVYSTVYWGADQRKHQSSALLAFVWGIHRDRWIPRTKGHLRGKYFHLMTSSCTMHFSNGVTAVLHNVVTHYGDDCYPAMISYQTKF